MCNVNFFVNGLNALINKMDLSLFEKIGELENLKLYDCFYMVDDEKITLDDFYLFCKDSYEDLFLEMLEENNLQWLQYGRTSSHYFDLQDTPLFNLYYNSDFFNKSNKVKAFMVLDELLNSLYNVQIEYNNGEIVTVNSQDIDTINNDYTQEELTGIIKEMAESLDYYATTIHSGYKWLNDFKENQVKYFKEWLPSEEN